MKKLTDEEYAALDESPDNRSNGSQGNGSPIVSSFGSAYNI